MNMGLSTAVIIATRQRPREVSNLLRALELQTVQPNIVVVSACDESDIEQGVIEENALRVLTGPPGLAAQRNRALSFVQGGYDIVVFFDDDFIPSRFWVERIQMMMMTHPDVGCVTGRVIVDGVTTGGIEWSRGQSIVDDEDEKNDRVTRQKEKYGGSPYGCNMAFRAKAIENLWFDERLPLYGWLEDRDFGFRVGTRTKAISTNALWGVHLGSNRGRVSGLRF